MAQILFDAPTIGISLYPDWSLDSSSFRHLTSLVNQGMRILQLPAPAASKNAAITKRVEQFLRFAAAHHLDCAFHLPVTKIYNPGFDRDCRKSLMALFLTLDSLLKRYGIEKSIVVWHGAHGTQSRAHLLKATNQVLEWCVAVLPTLKCSHRFLLENVTPREGIYRVGQDWDDFCQLQSVLSSDTTGICRDLGHELEAIERGIGRKRPPKALFSKVFLFHVHGTNGAGRGHYPIHVNSLPAGDSLNTSANAPIVIESLRDRIEGRTNILRNFEPQLRLLVASLSQHGAASP